GDDAGKVGRAVGAGDLDGDDAGARRHAGVDRTTGSLRGGAVAGDEAGHEGAVTVVVDAVGLAREVGATEDASGQVRGFGHARVHQRHADALAGVLVPDHVGVEGSHLHV